MEQRLAADDAQLARVKHRGQRFEIPCERGGIGELLGQHRRRMGASLAADVAMLRQAVLDAEELELGGGFAGHDRPRDDHPAKRTGCPTTSTACAAMSTAGADYCTDRKSTRLNSSHGYISYAV